MRISDWSSDVCSSDLMTYASVCDVAHAVAGLAERHPVQLQIHTMDWCREKADRDLGDLRGVQVQGLVAGSEYERTLAKSDALLIAYKFDPASTGYIGYSLANKKIGRASWRERVCQYG